MSHTTVRWSPASLYEGDERMQKPSGAELVGPPLTIQFLLYEAFAHGQRYPITANSVAFFDEWYEKKAPKLPEGLRTDRSICDLWDYLMERELE